MSLRQRILWALFGIVLVMAAPTAYAVLALRQLSSVTRALQTRDAEAALALGRLQGAFSELQSWERSYVALARQPLADRLAVRRRFDTNARRLATELHRLERLGYAGPARQAEARWAELRRVLAEEIRLVETGAVTEATSYRERTVLPAFAALDRALDPIADAINERVAAQVERSRRIATIAASIALGSLLLALLVAGVLGTLLARAILGPLGELRRAMGVVAQGEFDVEPRIPPDRRDELGDLARSFRAMTQQLKELDRLKAEFVSIASHELKTPLSVIRGYVSLLLEGIYGPLGDEQRKVLEAVSNQTDRLGTLIQQLLDIHRFEAGGVRLDVRPMPVRAFVRELATSFEALAQQNRIRFTVDVAEDVPETIVADPNRLNEAVGNLLSNAFKFTPPEGQIWLRVARRDGHVVFEVEDTGPGIPADEFPRIFEKFYQAGDANQRAKGSGLGLAIARRIVEAHGGTIAADSEVGRGSVFRIALPVDGSVPVGGAPST